MQARRIASVCACALALGCGSPDPPGSASDTNQAGDPQWGQGFATRLSDGGNPDAPSSVAQACALFGGEPYNYPSIEEVKTRLTSARWVGCADNSQNTNGFWPAGFTGIQFDSADAWRALVRAADGSIEPATLGNAAGTYEVDPYPLRSAQYAAVFIVHLLPVGTTDTGLGEQWQGYFEDSPEILFVESSDGPDAYRFSSAPP